MRASGGIDHQISSGMIIPIEEGTVNADKLFMLTTDEPINTGVTPLVFVEFGGGGGGGGVQLSDNNVWTGTNEFDGGGSGVTIRGANVALIDDSTLVSTLSGPTQAILSSRIVGDADTRFVLLVGGDMKWGDGTNPADTVLYRYGADSLGTDDRLVIKKTGALSDAGASILFRDDADAFSIGSIHTRIDSRMGTLGDWTHQGNHRWTSTITTQSITHEGGVIDAVRNSGTDVIHRTKVTGDNDYRYSLQSGGTLDWGDGTLPPDTNLYRQEAGVLATDGGLSALTVSIGGITLEQTTGPGGSTLFSGYDVEVRNLLADQGVDVSNWLTFGMDNTAYIHSGGVGVIELAGELRTLSGVNISDILTFGTDPTGYIHASGTSGLLEMNGSWLITDNLTVNGTTYIDGELAHNGLTAGFYNAAPVAQAAAITDATGGIVIDTEARAALNTLLQVVRDLGLIA
jgi:hypothetical protein